MNLYEYQGRNILESFSICIPQGMVVNTPEEAVKSAKILFEKTNKKSLVIKAQILAGGRGKSGGIKIVKNLNEVYNISKNMLGKFLKTPQTTKKGILVEKILISEDIYTYPDNNDKLYENKNYGSNQLLEYYLSLVLKKDIEKNIIIYSKKGGINIEDYSKKNPSKINIEKIDPILGLQPFQIRKIGYNLGMNNNLDSMKNFFEFLSNINKAYHYCGSLLIEINPFIKTFDQKIIPVDVKIILDDNNILKNKKYPFIKKIINKKNFKSKFNFLKLKGNVGCMVNGAGLAMATMDMIKSSGGEPSNFLDIGGTANEEVVEECFSLILKDKSIKAILINIFGGIVRCDTVAKGIINSCSKNNYIDIPIIVRFQGTNDYHAKDLLKKSFLPIYFVNTLKEASNKIKEVVL